MAERGAGVVRVATGEVVQRIVVEVDDDGNITTWGGTPEPAVGPGYVFDLSEDAQLGRYRQPDGSYGPPPPPPDLRSDAQKIADAIVEIDAMVQERIVTAGFVYNGLRFSTSKEGQLSWAAMRNLVSDPDDPIPEPLGIYVNNVDDSDGMFFNTAAEIKAAYKAGTVQGAAYKQVGAKAKKQLRELGAAAIPAVVETVRQTLLLDALDIIAGGG